LNKEREQEAITEFRLAGVIGPIPKKSILKMRAAIAKVQAIKFAAFQDGLSEDK
jgi:hypothetical protein